LRAGDSVETPRGHLIRVVSQDTEQRIYSLDAGDKLTLPNGQTITITAKGFEVTQ
jgi:phage gp45-like